MDSILERLEQLRCVLDQLAQIDSGSGGARRAAITSGPPCPNGFGSREVWTAAIGSGPTSQMDSVWRGSNSRITSGPTCPNGFGQLLSGLEELE